MKKSGFSLIELLAVLAIMSIIAILAVSSFSLYVAKGNLKRAQSDLEYMSVQMEYRYQRLLAHPTSEHLTTTALKTELPNWKPTSDDSDFNFSNANASSASYTLVATGLNGRVKNCIVSLSNDGLKTITNCAGLAPDGDWL